MKCKICGKTITGYPNNGWPVTRENVCDECNIKYVIPTRLQMRQINNNIEEEENDGNRKVSNK